MWSTDINCNFGVKQGWSLSPTIFVIYIDKLEKCLEEACDADTILAEIVIILLLYVDNIVLMARHPFDLNKQIRILKDFCSNMGMNVNTNKTKIRIIIRGNLGSKTGLIRKRAKISFCELEFKNQ